jgi:hypothetical protein
MKRFSRLMLAAAGLWTAVGACDTPAWITASNAQAAGLLEVIVKYAPETAAALGVEGHDSEVRDLKPDNVRRQEADLDAVAAQLSEALKHGVSTARAVFAFNSANVEGWALYSEAFMKPYLSPEAQLGVLEMRLMRCARAFLDPMVNLGMITPEQVKRILMQEVVLSEPLAKEEVDRYTFTAPGQATSYFFGYSKLEALRARADLALGAKFAPQSYHDFIIAQGLLPPDLLEKAVMDGYVKSQLQVPEKR